MADSPLHDVINDAVLVAFPAAVIRFDGPSPTESWWMDIVVGTNWVMVEWRPADGFAVSQFVGNTGYGEPHDPVFPDSGPAIAKILELLGR